MPSLQPGLQPVFLRPDPMASQVFHNGPLRFKEEDSSHILLGSLAVCGYRTKDEPEGMISASLYFDLLSYSIEHSSERPTFATEAVTGERSRNARAFL
jgi:hypothetical protein